MLIYCRLVASGVGSASLIILAFASPAMALISSNEASFMRFTLLNSFSKAFAAFIAVESDGKTMYFILYLFQ